MKRARKKLVDETMTIIMLFFFLRYDCGLKQADKLTPKDLKSLLNCLSNKANYDRM